MFGSECRISGARFGCARVSLAPLGRTRSDARNGPLFRLQAVPNPKQSTPTPEIDNTNVMPKTLRDRLLTDTRHLRPVLTRYGRSSSPSKLSLRTSIKSPSIMAVAPQM